MKDKLGEEIMKDFAGGLRAKKYSQLTNNNDEDKNAKGTKVCVTKNPLNLKIIKIENEIS